MAEMKRFEVGKTYEARSLCDYKINEVAEISHCVLLSDKPHISATLMPVNRKIIVTLNYFESR